MRKALASILAALAVLGGGVAAHHLTASGASSTGCGVERWSVKTGTDSDAASVDLGRTAWASVRSMSDQPRPSSLPSSSRVGPVEDTVYRMTVTLVQAKEEADSDIHLVIEGAAGRHMIAEIPAPACVASSSPFRPGIATARQALDARYRPTSSWQVVNAPVALTGVGFFDFNHSQAGVAPNAVELHPVLSIRFLGTPLAGLHRYTKPPYHDPPGGAD